MQAQRTALWRWLSWHRRELAAGSALAVVIALLAATGPMLLALAAIEWKHSRRRRPRLFGLALAALLARAIAWLWRDLRNLPHGDWHPCTQCGAPIEAPSRAWYCSPACRRYGRLERAARGGDQDAAARLARLRRSERHDPALAEVPF